MNYNFLKESIKEQLSSYAGTIAELENFMTFKDNNFILKHNIDAIFHVLKFLNSNENIFILNGFMGTGKTYVADSIINFVNDDVLVFRNSYQEAINLDDVLLSLFKNFSIYHNEKKVILPKIETNVFSEKINAYVKYCNVPMLFIFDSFEINMRSKDTQKDILDFINYLSRFEKIKVLICSRSFKQENLISQESSTEYKLKALTKEEVVEYLAQYSIQSGKYEIEEIYKETRGHYLLLELSVLIMEMLDISLAIFYSEYKKSAKNFLEFLLSKLLSFSSDKYIKFLIFLTALRHGVSKDFIINRKIADEDDILFLMQKHIITEKFGQYYIKDYMKSEIKKQINNETKINIHKYLINLYENELPLKPFERELFLSRLTMRQEIAFHTKKISMINEEIMKSGKNKTNIETQDFNYLSYSRTSGYETGMEKKKNTSEKRYISKIQKRVTPQSKGFELSNEDSKLLNISSRYDNLSKEMQEISTNINNNDSPSLTLNTSDNIPDSLDDYFNIAQNYEKAFNFSSAILYYKKALTYTDDITFNKKEPIIYTRLAVCHKKIQDTDEAVRLYEKAYELYLEQSPQQANEILLCIAKIYSEIYKFDKAKEIYKRILYSPSGTDAKTVIRVYLDLSEIDDNNMDINSAIKYVQMALKHAEKYSDISLLSECYFKYAILLDDTKHTDMALKYYLRCIQSSSDPSVNMYLSSAYTNLAELSKENKNITSAKMYYELAVEADKKVNNYEGLYYSYTKLAALYKPESSERTYEYLMKALSSAKRFDDISYTVNVYFELGDFYLETGDYKRALKSYILSKNLVPKHSEEEFNAKINNKISKIKIITGEYQFNSLLEEIKKKK